MYIRFASLLLVLAAVLATAAASPAHAASFTVTKTTDSADGACDTDCSLREAITAANTAPGADTISVPGLCAPPTPSCPYYALSISGADEDANATGDLDITDDVTIGGTGSAVSIIDGGGIDRVFDVFSGVEVTLANVTVRNGSVTGDGGGIRNDGTLTIQANQIYGNTSSGDGGGIQNDSDGTIALIDSNISNNMAADDGGGIVNEGPDTLTMIGDGVFSNTAGGNGGGIYNVFDATGTITESVIIDNSAGADGGGISNDQCCGAPALAITNSTISENTSAGSGGGISNASSSALNLINDTISGNSAGDGGGMAVDGQSTANLTNVTISANSASGGAGLTSSAEVTTVNTIIASNNGASCSLFKVAILSLGHNLDSGTSCGFLGAGDLQSTDPQLEPLAYNGGPPPVYAQTHALQPGSPARNAGDNDLCPATDQRGVGRPQESVCDIGAYEYQVSTPTPAPTDEPTVAPTQAPAALPPTGGVAASSHGNETPLVLALLAAAFVAGGWVLRRLS